MKYSIIFVLLFGVNSQSKDLPKKLFCGIEHYGCEDILVDTIEIETLKKNSTLTRIFKEGDQTLEATFVGEKISTNKEIVLKLQKNSFVGGKFTDGNLEVTVQCTTSTCKIAGKGTLKNWKAEAATDSPKIPDDDRMMTFNLGCNQKALTIERAENCDDQRD